MPPADGSTHPETALTALARSIVEAQSAALASAPRLGVRWSGLDPELPRVETEAAVRDRLERQAAQRAFYRASPEGRFRDAAFLIYEVTGDERLMDCWSRGLATNADCAAKLLATMRGPAADACREALADVQRLPMAAE